VIPRMAAGAFWAAAGLAVACSLHGGDIAVDLSRWHCWSAAVYAVIWRVSRALA
jgi:hypothetical protein